MPTDQNPDERPCAWHPDRLTMLSCGRCDRPMCVNCAVETPVGMRCRECAGAPRGMRAVAQRLTPRRANAFTMALIVANVVMFILQEVTRTPGAGGLRGGVTEWGWIYGPWVSDGEWYRIITGAFLHGSILHIVLNMFVLWQLGTILETSIGSIRFGLIYLVSVVWGSAGALIADPLVPTVGASGGVFGLFAALVILQWRLQGSVSPDLGLFLVLNLVMTFTVPGISVGGHVGGLASGGVAVLVLLALGGGTLQAPRIRASAVAGAIVLVVIGFAVGIAASHATLFGDTSAAMVLTGLLP